MSVCQHPGVPSSPCTPTNPLPLADKDPSRHSDLWLPDGSVVLQAERTLFRVHMSQLSRHSVVFRDMFALAQPQIPSPSEREPTTPPPSPGAAHATFADESCEGCPLVLLHDAAEDVANLLTALYDGPKFGSNDNDDFRIAAGILRLATKYVIDSLRTKALAHLSIAWPSTLRAWDTREDRARAFELEHGAECGHLYPSPIAVINLAREVHAPALLPAAFYDLSRYTYAQIFEASDDESSRFRTAPALPPPAPPAGAHPISMPTPMLSGADTQRLALGKEAAAQAVSAVIHGMARGPHALTRKAAFTLAPPSAHGHGHVHTLSAGAHTHGHAPTPASAGCASPGACRRDFAELVALATQHYICDRERGCADPLYVAEELGALKSAELSECGACARGLEVWAARERERMWKMLPLWFRLESWAGA